MGGNHKKFIRSEKAKVKLKGNKLPKGLNITKTEFKVKKIVIKEQLKENYEADGKKKHNIKDILSRLRHHNSSFRSEAVRNLKETIANNPDEIFRELGFVVQGISTLCLDTDKDIRRESFKVFNNLFLIFNETTIEPFFHIISSYLRCAMTHIQQTMQEDSLLLLDVLITFLPKLISINSEKIFGNFLEMISKLRTDSKPGRTLSVNIGNKITTTKWRSKILERLQKLLQLLIKDIKSEYKSIHNIQNTNLMHYYNEKELQYFSIFLNGSLQNSDMSGIFNRSIGSNEFNENDEGQKIKKYIKCLLPLLLESWLEVKPTTATNETLKSQLILNNDAASTLKIILEILDNLWEMTIIWEKKVNSSDYISRWFSQEFIQEFTTHILCFFPYQQSNECRTQNKQKEKTAKKDLIKSDGQYCLQQNLNTIYLYSVFYADKLSKEKEQSSKMLNYLIKTNNNLSQMPLDCLALFEKVLRMVLYVKGTKYLMANETKTNEVLRNIINQFQNDKFNKNSRANILAILCDIVLSDKLRRSYAKNEFKQWLPTLPILLNKSTIAEHSLRTLSSLGKHGNKEFLDALKQSIYVVIENVPFINVTGCQDKFEGQKLIMNLFFWINNWNAEELEQISKHIAENIKDQEIVQYFSFILKSK